MEVKSEGYGGYSYYSDYDNYGGYDYGMDLENIFTQIIHGQSYHALTKNPGHIQ